MAEDRKKRVLVVEDDVFQAKAYEIKFSSDGLEVILATDGEQAISHLEEDPADVVVLDLLLPGMSGFDVLQAIRKSSKWGKVPVVILSNLGQQQDISKGKALGANDYIIKTEGTLDSIIKRVEGYINK